MNATPPFKIANRRWFQWSLRSSLCLMLLLGVGFAWWGAELRKEARIKDAVRFIAASPGWWADDDYDPIALVRAVNALHALREKQAIDALRRFAKEYPSSGDPNDRHEALRLIIPLLFDRVDPEDKFPFAWAYDNPGVYRLDQREWPFFAGHIMVENDLPFHVVSQGGFSGAMGDCSYAIDWAEKSGRLRNSPLRPADSPFAAADQLALEIHRLENKPNNGLLAQPSEVRRRARQQVLTAVGHLLPSSEFDKYKYGKNWDGAELSDNYRDLADDANWTALNETCMPLGTHWSAERQTYVASRRD